MLLCAFHAYARDGKLDFVPNGRQWPSQVRFKADIPGGSVFLTNSGFTYTYYSLQDLDRIHTALHEQHLSAKAKAHAIVNEHAYRVRLLGSDTTAAVSGLARQSNYYNYFLGSDASRWSTGLHAYEGVKYSGVYKGIDLHFYAKGISPKYDFVVAPYADASLIQLTYEGVAPVLTAEGDLLLKTSVNEIVEKAPFTYQLINGIRRNIPCHYVLVGRTVRFTFPEGYDHSKPMVIDPTLVFASYSGSTSVTFGWSATYDALGNLYAGGECFGTGWPVTLGAYQTTYGGGADDGINKYNGQGSALIYSTYYGGSNNDDPNSMIVNSNGELIVAGTTQSANLPVTAGCYDNTYNGGTDVYVAHFNASATTLLGATYLGGSGDEGNASTSIGVEANRGEVLTDTSGNVYVAFGTTSPNFPTTPGAYQATLNGNMDGFVSKLSGNCSNLLFSTYIGGSDSDAVICMQRTVSGKIIVGGCTLSNNFPGTSGGWQASSQGARDGFIAVLNSGATSLLSASYVGTSGIDEVSKVQLDVQNNIYAAGKTNTGTFPVSASALRDTAGMNYLAEFDSALSKRIVSTTIGSKLTPLVPTAFLVDDCRNIYFVGFGAQADTLLTTADAFQTNKGGFWMNVMSPNMSTRIYASYFGAIGDHIDGGSSRLDPAGIVYHALCTSNTTAPTTPAVWAPVKLHNGFDLAAWKFNFQFAGMKAAFALDPDSSCAPGVISFRNTSIGAFSYLWDFGDGTTSTAANPPPHTYTAVGIYKVKLYTYNSAPCTPIDSDAHIVNIFRVRDSVKLAAPNVLSICNGDTLRMQVNPAWNISVVPNKAVTYKPTGGTQIVFYPDSDISYKVIALLSNTCGITTDTVQFSVLIDTSSVPHINRIAYTMLCKGDTAVYQLSHRLHNLTITPPDYWQISSDSLTLTFFPPVTTAYRLLGLGLSRCKSLRDTLDFTIHRSAVKAAFDLDPKQTDMLAPVFQLINRSGNYASFQWYLNDGAWSSALNPSYTASDTGRYCFKLVAKDLNGCVDTATDCALVFDPLIYIPSAFTPNGDSKNDIFRPIARNLHIIDFSVYNRYGQRIFFSYDDKQGWDGTFKGEPCDLDVYFYTVHYQVLNRDPQLLKGDVTLIR